jgi:hypothetical protein
MARLIGQKTGKNLIKQESDIFEDRIIQKLENTVVNYSKFFEGGPFFVTYYSKDLLKSTVQDSIDTSVGILGSDSPLKYNKIEKLPIYNFFGIEVDTEITDFGLESNSEGEGIIIPNTITPTEEDFFVIDTFSDDIIFKISKVENSKISGKQFWKIYFYAVLNEKQELEEKVVDNLIVNYDKLSNSNEKAVFLKEDYLNIQFFDQIIETIIEYVKDYFYYENLNYVRYEFNSNYIYDPYVEMFIIRNKLLIQPNVKNFYNSIYLSEVSFDSEGYEKKLKTNYRFTIFYALEREDYINIDEKTFSFDFEKAPMYFNELTYEGDTNIFVTDYDFGNTYRYFPEDFFNKIKNNSLYENQQNYIIENLIIKFFNNKLNNNELKQLIEEYEFDDDMKSFYHLFILLFILNREKNKLLIK